MIRLMIIKSKIKVQNKEKKPNKRKSNKQKLDKIINNKNNKNQMIMKKNKWNNTIKPIKSLKERLIKRNLNKDKIIIQNKVMFKYSKTMMIRLKIGKRKEFRK